MRSNKGGDPVGRAFEREIEIIVILPKHARITFVRQDVGIRQQFVICDRASLIAQVMIFHKSDSALRLGFQNRIAIDQILQAKTILIAQPLEQFAQGKIKCIHRVGVGEVSLIDPVERVGCRVPEFSNTIWNKGLAIAHVMIFLNGGDGIGAIAFDKVITKTVEADFLDQPAREF